MDKDLIRRRFTRAIGTYPKAASVQQEIAYRMEGLLQGFCSPDNCGQVLEVGCGTGCFTRRLLETMRPGRLLINDICPDMEACFTDLLSARVTFVAGDAECCDFPAGNNLVVSCSALQWFEHPEAFLRRCGGLLADEGLLAFSTFGPDNLREVSAVSGAGVVYSSVEELLDALSAGFDILHAEEQCKELLFPSPLDVLRHLQQTGVTGLRRRWWTKSDLERFCSRYAECFGVGSDVCLTYHPIYVIAKKKIER